MCALVSQTEDEVRQLDAIHVLKLDLDTRKEEAERLNTRLKDIRATSSNDIVKLATINDEVKEMTKTYLQQTKEKSDRVQKRSTALNKRQRDLEVETENLQAKCKVLKVENEGLLAENRKIILERLERLSK